MACDTCNSEVDEPLSQRSGEFLFCESQQSVHLEKITLSLKTEKPKTMLSLGVMPQGASVFSAPQRKTPQTLICGAFE
jgi:hypothetical protein